MNSRHTITLFSLCRSGDPNEGNLCGELSNVGSALCVRIALSGASEISLASSSLRFELALI